MATVNELVTALGFELKPDALKNINSVEVGLSHLQDAVGKLGRMLTDGLSMKDYFGGALTRSQDILNSAKAIGMSTDALQEWQYAAKASGVSAEAVISDIENLRANFFMTEKGLLNLADSFKKMSAGSAYWYGNMYGLSKDTVLMLRQGSAALKELQDEAHRTGAITPLEEIENAVKLNKELEKRKLQLQKVVDTIVLKVSPAITKLFEKFDAWLAEDPGRAEMVLQGITGALIGLASSEILSGLGSLINFIKSLMLSIVALGPYAAVIGGVGAAAYALYKDFQRFQNGEDSWIDWDNSPVGLFIRGFIDGLQDAYGWLNKVMDKFIDWVMETKKPDLNQKTKFDDLSAQEKDDIVKGRKTYKEVWADKFWSQYNAQTNPEITASGSLANEVSLKPSSIQSLAETINQQASAMGPSLPNKETVFTGTTVNVYSSQDFGEIMNGLQDTLMNTNESGIVLNMIQ